jgi:hypothetical protein
LADRAFDRFLIMVPECARLDVSFDLTYLSTFPFADVIGSCWYAVSHFWFVLEPSIWLLGDDAPRAVFP